MKVFADVRDGVRRGDSQNYIKISVSYTPIVVTDCVNICVVPAYRLN